MVTSNSPTNIKPSAMGSEIQVLYSGIFFFFDKIFYDFDIFTSLSHII